MNPRVWLLLVILAATGCQSIKMRTGYDHTYPFGNLRSFCWVAPPAYLANDPRLRMELLTPLMQEQVQAQLIAKGFTSTDCATADFQVSFRAALQDEIVENQRDPGYSTFAIYEYSSDTGGTWFTSSTGADVDVQRAGTLTIVITEAKTGRPLWHGAASANLRSQVSQSQRKQRIETIVRELIEKFPPAPKKK